MSKTNENITGTRIKLLLKKRNMKQKHLAEQIGTTVQTVSKWVNGHMRPDSYFLIKLSDFFGVSERYLLGEIDEDSYLMKTWDDYCKNNPEMQYRSMNVQKLYDYIEYLGYDLSELSDEETARLEDEITAFIEFKASNNPKIKFKKQK